jgi:hypothetical protein
MDNCRRAVAEDMLHHCGASLYQVDDSICETQTTGSLYRARNILYTSLFVGSIVLVEELASEIRERRDNTFAGQVDPTLVT